MIFVGQSGMVHSLYATKERYFDTPWLSYVKLLYQTASFIIVDEEQHDA